MASTPPVKFHSPLRLHNPIALAAVGGVGIVRGVAYIVSEYPLPEWLGDDVGPGVPLIPLWLVGVVWLIAGVYLHV